MSKEVAILGMGCFWAPQKLFDGKEGVLDTKVGFTGGAMAKLLVGVCRRWAHRGCKGRI